MSRLRRLLAVLIPLTALSTGPAVALSRSGALNLRYDNITVSAPSGSEQRSSFFQGYNLNLEGDLMHRAVGTFRLDGAYSQGGNVDTSVNSDSPRQRIIGGSGSAQLFSPFIQKYVSLEPNYSVQSMKLSGSSGMREHTITNTGGGFRSGLTLWKLPGISVTRQYNAVKNLDGPAPTEQRLTFLGEALSYRIGGARLKLSQERRKTEDKLSSFTAPVMGTRRGSLDYNRYEIKRLGLQSFSVNANYQGLTRDAETTQKSLTNRLGLRSRDMRTKNWKHILNYSNDSRRDILVRQTVVSHYAQLASNRPIRRGTLTNSLTGNLSTSRVGMSRGAGAASGIQLNFAGGRVTASANGDARLTRGATGLATFSDALGTRLNLKPRPSLDLFADIHTSGAQPLSEGGGRQRTQRYEMGGARKTGLGEASIRYNRTEQRDFSQHSKSVNNQINLLGSAVPAARLNTNAGFNFSTTQTNSGRSYTSRNFRGGLTYRLLCGLHLNADISFAEIEQYNTAFGAYYSLGKTSLKLTFRHAELPASASYSHMSFSLTRAL